MGSNFLNPTLSRDIVYGIFLNSYSFLQFSSLSSFTLAGFPLESRSHKALMHLHYAFYHLIPSYVHFPPEFMSNLCVGVPLGSIVVPQTL